MAIVAIIPARYGSTRLPGKPLSEIHGKTLIQRVHERVCAARSLDRVLVATDDERIAAAVRSFGGEAVLTSSDHRTGTDRLAEAARSMQAEVVVNAQGDEPMLDPAAVDAMVGAMLADRSVEMATVSLPLRDVSAMADPSVVKVVTDARGDALYFSRSPVPFVRVGAGDVRSAAEQAVARGLARQHVGLYAYRHPLLLRLTQLPPAPLEEAEGLEQLRALHNGTRIRVVAMEGEPGVAVDTPRDLERVRTLLAPKGGSSA